MVPYTVTSFYTSLASLILISAILAASVNLLAGHGGLLSIGHAGIAAASSYGYAWAIHAGWSVLGAIGMAAVLTLGVSLVFGLMAMRTSGIFFIMVTLALGMVVFGLTFRLASITGGENGLSGIRRPGFISEYWQFYFLCLAAFVACTVALWVVARSPYGTSLRGIRDSESRMLSLGYQISRYKLGGMMISGSVAGIAGLLAVWHSQFISPTSAGFGRSALIVVIVILGGVGTTFGPLVGAAVVMWIENVLSSSVERWPTLLGLAFILVIVFAPQGIVGGARELVFRRRARRSVSPPELESVDPASPAAAVTPPPHPQKIGHDR
ncbi:branched-chain amino acid ABC transporter permease [Georgenia sp. SYP-B2076]|uniref:branched-chain amino acid ABC transporter permease n=1 Tax=Georgenia sp. SYP-B2076 TaxID=2495881 RepID=UPI0013DF8425|nr:branched-chain amino acid ABC transporter permease [Georgenia sp. SYP-B2076]